MGQSLTTQNLGLSGGGATNNANYTQDSWFSPGGPDRSQVVDTSNFLANSNNISGQLTLK